MTKNDALGHRPMTAAEQKDLAKRVEAGVEAGLFRYAEVAVAIYCGEATVRGWVRKGGHVDYAYQDPLRRFLDLAKA